MTERLDAIIKNAYKTLLLRDPDPDGYKHHYNLLTKGKIDEAGLLSAIKRSAEYKQLQIKNIIPIVDEQTLNVWTEGSAGMITPLMTVILQMAFPDKKIIWNDAYTNPDIVIRGPYFLLEKKKKYSCSYVTWCGEPLTWYGEPTWWSGESWIVSKMEPIICSLQAILSNNKSNEFYVPFIVIKLFGKDLLRLRKYDNFERPYFCVYVASNSIEYRERVFAQLRKYSLTAHGLGRCSNTGHQAAGSWRDLEETYKDYKFALVMENSDIDGYITEKIANAFIAGCIPIYWGSRGKIKKMFNPESFIYLSDFATTEDAIEYIKKVDQNDELRREILNKPLFIDNKIPDILNVTAESKWIKNIAKHISESYEKALLI